MKATELLQNAHVEDPDLRLEATSCCPVKGYVATKTQNVATVAEAGEGTRETDHARLRHQSLGHAGPVRTLGVPAGATRGETLRDEGGPPEIGPETGGLKGAELLTVRKGTARWLVAEPTKSHTHRPRHS